MSLDRFFLGPQSSSPNDRSIEEAIERIDASGPTLEARYLRLRRKHERLELLVEGLVCYLEERGVIDREVLRVVTQRLDLADGVEDGRLGPDRSARAPKCAVCGAPFNKKRDACIYCGASKAEAAPRVVRETTCVACSKTILESAAYITMNGLVCPVCFSAKQTGAGAGRLSLSSGTSGALSEASGASGALSEPE